MFRVTLGVVIVAAVISTLLHINVWIVMVPAIIFGLGPYLLGLRKATCPYCGSHVKFGMTVCRFCGRDTTIPPNSQ